MLAEKMRRTDGEPAGIFGDILADQVRVRQPAIERMSADKAIALQALELLDHYEYEFSGRRPAGRVTSTFGSTATWTVFR